MRKVVFSDAVNMRLFDLERYLQHELHFSKPAARRRSQHIRNYVFRLRNPMFNTARCRSRKWHALGYHCISFDGWVFAYEYILDGVVVRDMMHSSLIADVVY
jgi:hypothetical protein